MYKSKEEENNLRTQWRSGAGWLRMSDAPLPSWVPAAARPHEAVRAGRRSALTVCGSPKLARTLRSEVEERGADLRGGGGGECVDLSPLPTRHAGAGRSRTLARK